MAQHQHQHEEEVGRVRGSACFRREEHWQHRTNCVFRYSKQTIPVEPRFVGQYERWIQPFHNPRANPWFLRVTNFQHLHNVMLENTRIYFENNCFIVRDGVRVYEFGSHLFADRHGFLRVIDISQVHRDPIVHVVYSDIYYVNDVTPKLRALIERREHRDVFRGRTPRYTINTLSITRNLMRADRCGRSRYWFRFGREAYSRFYEWQSIDECMTPLPPFDRICGARPNLDDGHEHNEKINLQYPYFGIFVDRGTKLIIRDNSERYQQYNHTLVQSGVFIALQSQFRFRFMDNTHQVYVIADLLAIPGRLPNNHIPEHPIVVLRAVPSVTTTNCWTLVIEQQDIRNAANIVVGVQSVLNVPLLGMNDNRMRVLEWNVGFAYVQNEQRVHNYRQFATYHNNDPGIDPHIRQFVPNEQLAYPHI